MDIIGGNYIPFLQATQQGFDLRIIAHNSDVDANVHGLFVRADSDIQGPSDLKGKRVGVNTLQNLGELAYNEYLETGGLSPQDVSFTEVSFGDQATLLERGEIDVAWLPSSFRTAAEASGNLRLLTDFSEIPAIKDLPNTGFVTTSTWAEDNAEVLAELRAALAESAEYANAHPDEVRTLLQELTRMPEETAQNLTLENFDAEVDTAQLQRMAELMHKWEFIDEVPDMEQLYVSEEG